MQGHPDQVLANYTENGRKMEMGKNAGSVRLKGRLTFGLFPI
jgi:hypothetical protein